MEDLAVDGEVASCEPGAHVGAGRLVDGGLGKTAHAGFVHYA